MPPTVRSVSTASHDTGTVTVTKPSGTVAGDRLVAICTRDEGAGTNAWGSNLFTLVDQTTVSGRGRIQVWQRTAGGSEPSSYTYTDSSGNSTGTVHLFAIRDIDASAVIVAAFGNGAASNSATAPSIASGSYTGTDPLLLCGYYALINTGARTWTPSSGMTAQGTITPPFQYTSAFAASINLTGNVATGTRTATMSSTGKPWIAVSVAIPSLAAPPQTVTLGGGIASAEAFGTPAVSAGAVSVGAGSIASAEALGTPTLAAGGVSVTASGIPSAEALGSPTLALTVAPSGIGSGEAFGTAIVNVGPTLSMSGVPSAEAFGALTVVAGPIVVTDPGGVASGEAFGTPSVIPLIKPSGIGSAEAFGAPAVVVGAVTLGLVGIPSAEAFGAALVVPGAIPLGPTGIPSAEALGVPRINLQVVAAGIPSGEAFGTISLTIGGVIVRPVGIASLEAFGTPSLTVTIDPAATRGILAPRTTATYELICVARIPASSGAPSFLEVERVEWRTLSWSSALSAAQTLTATCPIAAMPEVVLQRLRTPDRLATEFWLQRDGRQVFAGPFATWRRQGENLQIDALGVLAYAQLMFVTSDLRFDQVDQHAIAAALVDHWQNGQPFGHFGIDTTGITPSGVLRDRSYVAVEGHQISRRLQELGAVEGGFDSDVDPTTRRLELWTPTKGIDRSSGSDAIVLDERNIADPNVMLSVAPQDLASLAFGTSTSSGSDTTLWSGAVNEELRAAYGAAAVMSSWSDISEQATLDAHVDALLNARDQALLVPGPKTRVTADADIASYDVGDTVAFIDTVLGASGAFRIRKRTVDVDESGQETATLEFV